MCLARSTSLRSSESRPVPRRLRLPRKRSTRSRCNPLRHRRRRSKQVLNRPRRRFRSPRLPHNLKLSPTRHQQIASDEQTAVEQRAATETNREADVPPNTATDGNAQGSANDKSQEPEQQQTTACGARAATLSASTASERQTQTRRRIAHSHALANARTDARVDSDPNTRSDIGSYRTDRLHKCPSVYAYSAAVAGWR
jgi:hypothetical protein